MQAAFVRRYLQQPGHHPQTETAADGVILGAGQYARPAVRPSHCGAPPPYWNQLPRHTSDNPQLSGRTSRQMLSHALVYTFSINIS